MRADQFNTKGLNDSEVIAARLKYGQNSLSFKRENGFIKALTALAKEPMVLLLLVTSGIYFISGKPGDGFFLAAAIVLVAAISLYQDSRSRNALEKLKDFSQPKCKVIRNGEIMEIDSASLVVGDALMVEEGMSVMADGRIVHSNDFSVNESILTGESLAVYKDSSSADPFIFHGTTVASGLAIATITAIGNQTRLGQIGKSLEQIEEEKTPLERQINNFVKKMVIAGLVVFLAVWAINYLHTANILDSLIKALTLAMSILPEEIPVAFTTFMALGAWRMMKMGIVVKQMKTVETLGSASVICTDKTGTLTENKMSLAKVYTLQEDRIADAKAKHLSEHELQLISLAMWASEPIPFDPMEVALHAAYAGSGLKDERHDYRMIHEYPLGGKPPMMTHLFENEKGHRIIAAKGAPEALISISHLNSDEKRRIASAIEVMAAEGYRILAVGEGSFTGDDFPARQQEFTFAFKGLVAFYDPPKKNISAVLQEFYRAGIAVKIITGDNAETTGAIARQIGFQGADQCISGDALMELSGKALSETVEAANIFTRMFPDAKLKIINALKAKNEVVAMTGDGVNDGPALKAAHIGIAMGKKGTEIAKQAASLILLEDDLSKMVAAIAMGRRIYANLKKAIQYIISIHIPIILTVFMPLALGWAYPNIFSPVHIIFLELIMGPTCSIIYENEPMEKNTMLQKPRPFSTTFFHWKELTMSVIQGLVITGGTLATYQYAVSQGADEPLTRTMVFVCLITANILLTLVNRSFYYSLATTIRYKNNLVLIIIGVTLLISASLIYLEPLAQFFGFKQLNINQMAISLIIGFISVTWFELYKWRARINIGS
ncbi:cation-translocating P-type ATPase [Mucilaginibacter rigui]|uniref:Cation-translocating P-type ATPase n=1 Tax=Mucilaginibacter rigui TaxID=534635 RepID=A0ABR7X1Z5_9SPHI|nr:cation-translocating P-type ATPase [Mucilaginibacter rigui]MBD1384619.1 cation-translocating P-type ATPase [Mucilaginibacter rigui]